MHILKHFFTITKHRHKVMHYCFKAGLYWQGLIHDLSKYSFIEFFNGAKYYAGIYSPHLNERKAKGYSNAWMHHKGRNYHHCEFWTDYDNKTKTYIPVEMPDKYIAESFCDRLAATKVYSKKDFKPQMVLDYFLKTKDTMLIHPKSKEKLQNLLEMYVKYGESYTFKYIKKNMRK